MFACMKIWLMCKVYQPVWSILVYRQAGQACMRKVVHLSRLFGQGLAIDVAYECMDMHPSINDPQGIFSTPLS
jgi:hypothetical protein